MKHKICFRLKVIEGRMDEYVSRHAEVWPEMLRALHDAGWRNYSLFLDRDGLLIGYFETENLQSALDDMASTEVNTRWQSDMAEFFELPEGASPDNGFIQLKEIFNLEKQLEKAV